MKALIFLLVLANLLFYAYSAGLLGTEDSGEGARIAQQLRPDSIRIVSRDAPPEGGAAAAEAGEASEGEVVSQEIQACLRWESLTRTETDRLGRVIEGGFADFAVSRQTETAEPSGWWVFMPAQPDRVGSEKKAQELKALGLKDYFIVQEGPSRNAISLGIFSSEKGARDRLAQLQAQGVRTARVGARGDREANQSVEVRGPSLRREALLAALAEALPGRQAKDCP